MSLPLRRASVHWRLWLALPVLLVLLYAVSATVWPTRYRYDTLRLPNGLTIPTRTDRFTGRAEQLWPHADWAAVQPRSELYEQYLRETGNPRVP